MCCGMTARGFPHGGDNPKTAEILPFAEPEYADGDGGGDDGGDSRVLINLAFHVGRRLQEEPDEMREKFLAIFEDALRVMEAEGELPE